MLDKGLLYKFSFTSYGVSTQTQQTPHYGKTELAILQGLLNL